MGAIGPTLVTWVKDKSLRELNITLSTYQYLQPKLLSSLHGLKMHCVLSICIYIEKKRKKKREEGLEQNIVSSQPKEVNLKH